MRSLSSQKGFTLVELAIVLMIIGLLIGGILKGQELIENARIVTIGRQIKSFDAATLTFQDSYGALPGDITSPGTRLPNCTASPCNLVGNGNGIIGPAVDGGLNFNDASENNTYWFHLNTANLISGFDSSVAPVLGTLNMHYPPTPVGGVYYVVNYTQGADAYYVSGLHAHYMFLGTVNAAQSAFTYLTSANKSARIDRKYDDGKPWTGSVILAGGAIATGNGTTGNEYDLTSSNNGIVAFEMEF